MVPLLLETRNFQSHRECILDFTKLDKITLIIGEYEDSATKSNGVGKSGIFDAISWVLFDQSRVSGTKILTNDDLIRHGESEMQVRYTFIAHDKNTYRITKTHKKKRYQTPVSIEFEVKQGNRWRPVDKDGNRETKKKIVEVLGFDSNIWECTALCKQHEVTGIASADSNERLNLIKRLLKLDKWADYAKVTKSELDKIKEKLVGHTELTEKAEEAKERIKELQEEFKKKESYRQVYKKKIEVQGKKIDEIRVQIDELNKILGAFEQLKVSEKQNEERRKGLIEENTKLKKKLEESKVRIEVLKEEHKEKKDRLNVIENTRPNPEKILNAHQKVQAEKEALQTKLGSLEGRFSSINEQGKTQRAELEEFKKLGVGVCSKCKNQITKEHLEETSKEYERRLGELRSKVRIIKDETVQVKERLGSVEKEMEQLVVQRELYNKLTDERNRIVERLRSIAELVQALQSSDGNITSQIEVNFKELESLRSQSEKIKQQLSVLGSNDTTTRHKTLIEFLKEENKKLDDLNNQLVEVATKEGLIKNQLEECKVLIERVKQGDKTLIEFRNRVVILESLYQDFQKTIPTMILENSTSLIESEVNRCLATLSDGFLVRINTQHKNKTNNNIKEVFDIQVIVGDHVRPFELLSGGEQFRVAFAIRVALSIILAQETGIQIGAIFYDEPFNDLDEEGLDRIQDIFVYLSSVFEHQLAITHQSRLKEIFNDVVCVKKGKAGSYIAA